LVPFHSIFLSCNDPIVETSCASSGDLERKGWCNSCEKCVFVFLLLSAFLSPPQVQAIFGADLLSVPALETMFLAVLGRSPGGVKPFECIGTPEESVAALKLTVRRHFDQTHQRPLPEMLLRLCTESQVSATADNSPVETVRELLAPRGGG
jgi:UDP-N-acetyl-alpha-D-muramoyl-L-alanyl-L-glutamate epimerase